MAHTTKVIDGDLLMLRIVFPDGTTATVTAGRDGKSVSVVPDDGRIAERLSSIFHWSTDKVGEPGYPFTSLNQVIYGMETLARSAMSVEQFVEGLREVLEVSDRRPTPEVGIRTPSFTVVDLSPSGNGWFVDARFQNGERFKLAINKASIGWAADPPESIRDKEVMRLLSGLKGARGPTDEELALLVMEVANYSSDIAGWLQGLHSAITDELKP
ncbi:hypothetical protein ILT44_04270 [Microvirga sp. BT689]|uniref:hypothetical protein n=1 Tax=Microvirga arvi TaxID=2778731 RepID=UPI00194FDFA4|nr:hypothetical protein [Microvirga arvi]MBM6579390.1 hypothetical protein [Microvirga arvi]